MENTVEEEITVRESESITERKRSRSLSPSDNLVPSHQRGEMRFQSIYTRFQTRLSRRASNDFVIGHLGNSADER